MPRDISEAEWEFIKCFARESDFGHKESRYQLRALWTAFCLHIGYDVDSIEYGIDLARIWDILQKRETFLGAMNWDSFETFNKFMRKYLR